ncbi:MAG: HAD-IA family hydrolase [Candidatus Marsarchaeota archaeon]|nr:HAD-IA family hydrolase [Candidatus Marsarchaeota archaeon]MCL5412985.1 HAD-IA family hydrolase [Candidatus Marsarchaeota archaeon]
MQKANIISKKGQRLQQITIRYILLDVHGVLTDGKERKRFIYQMEKKYGMNYDLHNSLWGFHLGSLDRGSEKPNDYIKVINKVFDTHFHANEYYKLFTKQIKANKVLIKELSKIESKKVCIVSDNFPSISATLPKVLGNHFKKYKKFYSFKLHKTKSEGMLQTVLKKLDVKPGECLFIDDNDKHVKEAIRSGINAVLFSTNSELFNDLKKYNISLQAVPGP